MSKWISIMAKKQKEDLDKWFAERRKEMTLPDAVEVTENIAYLDDGNLAHRLDVFRSKNLADGQRLPVIVNIHGGGLLMGQKEINSYLNAWTAQQGYLVFGVEYRMVPEVQTYQQYHDVSSAMDKVDELLDQFGGDREHVYIVSDSGGAYLAVYVAALQKSKKMAEAAKVRPSRLPIKALGLQSGMFYTTKLDKIGIFMPLALYGKGYKKKPFYPYLNPEHPELIRSLPPCYLMTSGDDYLRNYTLWFAEALKREGKEYELADYPKGKDLQHAFGAMYPERPEVMEANQKMLEWMKKR